MSRRPKLTVRPSRRHPLAAIALHPAHPDRPSSPDGRSACRGPAGPAGPGGRTTDAPAAGSGGPTGQMEQALRTVGLLAVTSAVGWLLTSEAVSGPLAIPLTSLDDLRRWLDDGTAAILPAALLRLAALGLCAYLALALVLTLIAQLLDHRTGGRAVRAVRRLLPSALRSLLTGSAQCSLIAATAFPLAAAPAAADLGDPGPTATMAKLDPDDPSDRSDSGDPGTSVPVTTSTATMTRLPAETPPTTGATPTTVTTTTTIAPTTAPTSLAPVPIPPRASAPASPATPADTHDETWTVTSGDTFWSIAEEALTDRRGQLPTQHEIVRYWHQLITSNRSRLAAPANPDLLLPGQSLLLPPPS